MQLVSTPTTATAEEVAAALAAVTRYLAAEAQVTGTLPLPRSTWQAASNLEAQGLPVARAAAQSNWASAERQARATRWSQGILGL